jgi:uncharacterized protein YdcH (DUF465 family)
MCITNRQIRKDPAAAHRLLDDEVDSLAGDRLRQHELPELKRKRLLAKDLAAGLVPSG